MRKLLVKIVPILILLITISSVNAWTDLIIGNTTIWWIIYALILLIFVKSKKYFLHKENRKYLYVLFGYLAWNIICIFRGLFVAENYWEWKNLVSTSLVLLMPLTIYVATNKLIVQRIVLIWLKYALPAFFIFYLFIWTEAIGRYLVPISFLFLFFPIIENKWKLVLCFFTLLVLFSDLGARSNVIKFAVPIIFAGIYYIRVFVSVKMMEIGRLLLLLVPIILFGLGISGIFNVFKMDDYIQGEYTNETQFEGEQVTESLTADTRTFLYVEVLESAIRHNYILFGRTPARGNDSESFGSYLADELKTGKMERPSNEVSILNVFTWTGVIGVILYFLVFYKASYLAVNKSQNIFIKIIGLYITFRWSYAWVEDFSQFDLSNTFLWISIGMCFSKSFRSMSDKEFIIWVKGIFDRRYRKLEFYILKKRKEWLIKK
ncbi:hypothetical protein MPF19_14100 [Polaribacter sp. Z014]|uniref:hypothetical protein n=1 Tax=Polaribacter sp. Z014 TaxID=2927126 RepID=UPI0020209CFA|nr:hypothetical protein [Polaribacter sp. Z014]MCL7764552.1 hypothetical protein [Polaribacter sp. Z014]